MADKDSIQPIPQPPSKVEQVLRIAKLGAIAILTVAGSLLSLHTAGTIILPPAILGVIASLTAIGTALGIASGGLRQKPPADPDELK